MILYILEFASRSETELTQILLKMDAITDRDSIPALRNLSWRLRFTTQPTLQPCCQTSSLSLVAYLWS